MPSIKEYKKGISTRITKNFKSEEFDCKCNYPDCTKTYIDVDHVKKLQKKRNKWRKGIKVLSGYRCPKHNTDVGGAFRSRHKMGDASDIIVKGKTPDKVADGCEDFNGLGRYDTFTHVDSRPLGEKNRKARWNFKKNK